jgi:hypothetical protein
MVTITFIDLLCLIECLFEYYNTSRQWFHEGGFFVGNSVWKDVKIRFW